MRRLVPLILLTGCILSFNLFYCPYLSLTNHSLKDKKKAIMSEAVFTYNIEELYVFPSPEAGELSIHGRPKSIKFNQKFVCYMGSADKITLKMEKYGNSITIKEIWPFNYAVRGTALYKVTGFIQGLRGGDYTLTFVYIDHSQNTTTQLYERTVYVGEGEGGTFFSRLILGSIGVAVAGIIIVTVGSYLKKKQSS